MSEKIYPSWRYHRSLEPRIVKSEQEDLALGSEWAHTPAAFLSSEAPGVEAIQPEDKPKKKKGAKS